ncbi:undecaprenyl-phosphate glucose phosphotransferase [Namhaeicola litoreus]|uniref:Undecaprenyl-phosphate glucose phosphotransferase n=1 Tax=Namhaeicola litoreus TaxID=1052145 RepID=A0ABW3Y0E4_9FLAO
MKKRYSKYIAPIALFVNLLIVNSVLFLFFENSFGGEYYLVVNSVWLASAYFTNFYKFKRHSRVLDVYKHIFLQFLLFSIAYFAYFTLTSKEILVESHLRVLLLILLAIATFRSFYFAALQKYRALGGNYRKVVLMGNGVNIMNFSYFLGKHPEMGYQVMGFFNDTELPMKNYLGKIESSFSYMLKNDVDEIICSINDLSKDQIEKLIHFADNNLRVLKFLPDSDKIYTTKMEVEYFDCIPVLSLRKIPFDNPVNQLFKRSFDVLFSMFIIVFVLSWLTPLLFVLIKLESKGPLFFKQQRHGLKGNQFICYKFRSMFVNDTSEAEPATKSDCRVTTIGKFLRKTSIDELPQFINVLKGEMSIVGPRPHMLSQTEKYAKIVDKFMVRHMVKPGITGLAQTSGYRGEIEKNADMSNRVRFDIFYIENWSFLLDLKIMAKTVYNALRGDIKAY